MEEKQIKFKRPLRVLVVEDNKVDQRMLEAILTESSVYTSFLKIADSLKDALKFLDEHKFDIILLDLDLPDSKGEDTLRTIISQYPKTPVVVNTGAYEEELGLQTLRLGAQDFLVKGKYTAYTINKVLHYAVERKRLEMDLVNAYEKLKDTQNQLIQAEKMKVVGGLASGVAHEVKNPLATILYGATYLSEQGQASNENYATVVQNIKDAAHRANDIITDLLDFSSLSELHKQKENLNNILEKSLSLVQHEVEKNHIQLIRELDDKISDVNIDKNRVEQVLINLMLNAIQASPDGGKIILKTYKHKLSNDLSELPSTNGYDFKAGANVIILNVEDSGDGIPEDKVDKVFDPFFTTRRAGGGVGLGLAVCRNIMDTHQGAIFIENKKEGGIRATLIFKV